LIGVHVFPPVHSLVCEQTWKFVAAVHDVLQREPVNPETYGEFGHVGSVVTVPVPQHTVPLMPAQSGAPSHCQSVVMAAHAVPAAVQVDVPVAGSQQCSPAVHVVAPPSPPLNGQYTPAVVSE
jgi:hypothetical protein